MKVMLILIVLGILLVVAFFYLGGITSMNPAEQAETFRRQVKVGMTWQQVADLKQPRKFYVFNPDPQSMTGQFAPQKFDRSIIENAIKKGSWDYGFGFDYNFTGDHAWAISFDSTGKMVAINDILTTKGLLEGKAFMH